MTRDLSKNGFEVLKTLNNSESPLTVDEIAEQTGIGHGPTEFAARFLVREELAAHDKDRYGITAEGRTEFKSYRSG